MKRRTFLKHSTALMAAGFGIQAGANQEQKRPNILWVTCEDISPHLGSYGYAQAHTPHLDALASQGVRYENACSVAGVCAPTRSCIITGCYPTSIGTHHMRSSHVPPEEVRCFSAYLRDAGYFCTNNKKTDYNFPVPEEAWDECSHKAHWRHRKDKDQPFFSIFNFTVTHESCVGGSQRGEKGLKKYLPEAERHDPAQAKLPPYYPDSPVVRKHWAHYYDLITVMDKQVGEILSQLEEDGLAENTLVIFFGDHGVGLPRGKRWLYDSGIRIPLLARWPKHIKPGSVDTDLVSFIDLAPSMLAVAGLPQPEYLQGQAFLAAPEIGPRDYLYAIRDRMDERYDCMRAVRNKRYKYIRNYMPYMPYDQHIAYPESFPVMPELRRIKAEGKLNATQELVFQQRKPLEEFYDLEKDPHEIHNLIQDAAITPELSKMRTAMQAWIVETQDLGMVPEMELPGWLAPGYATSPLPNPPQYTLPEGMPPTIFGRKSSVWLEELNSNHRLARLHALVVLGLAGEKAVPLLEGALQDPEPALVIRATEALRYLETLPETSKHALGARLASSSPTIALAAAGALARHQDQHEASWQVIYEALKSKEEKVRLYAITALDQAPVLPAEARLKAQEAREDKDRLVQDVAKHLLEK